MDGSRMDRRDFLTVAGLGAISAADLLKAAASKNASQPLVELSAGWCRPGAEFSMAPFWFWNDRLTEDEISRQMADFRDHGVYAFVIHPRVGLPRDIGWMSNRMLHFMRFTIEEARRTGIGSSSMTRHVPQRLLLRPGSGREPRLPVPRPRVHRSR